MNTERPLDTAAPGHQTADWKEHVRHQHSGRWQGPLGRMQVQIIQQAAPHFLSQAEDAPCTRQDSIPQPVRSRRFSLTSLIKRIMQLFQRNGSAPQAADETPPAYSAEDPRCTADELPPYANSAVAGHKTCSRRQALQTTTAAIGLSWTTLKSWLFRRPAPDPSFMPPPLYAVIDPMQAPRNQISAPPYSAEDPAQETQPEGEVRTDLDPALSHESREVLRQSQQRAFDILDRGSQFKLQLLVHTHTLDEAQQAFQAQNSAAGKELIRKARQQLHELDRHLEAVSQVCTEASALHSELQKHVKRKRSPQWLDALEKFVKETRYNRDALASYHRELQKKAGRFTPAPNSVMFEAAARLAQTINSRLHVDNPEHQRGHVAEFAPGRSKFAYDSRPDRVDRQQE